MDSMGVLDDQIEQLRESGIGYGLSDKQIDICILGVLSEIHKPSEDEPNSGQNKTRKCKTGKSPRKIAKKPSKVRKCCKIYCGCMLGLLVLIVAAVAVIANSETCTKWIEKKVEPLIYPITKNWRLFTLPLARRLNLEGYYNEECLIPNPLATLPPPPCEDCKRVTREHELYDATPRQFENNYLAKAQPLVLREIHENVTFDNLKSWYEENTDTFTHRFNAKLLKGAEGLTTITHLLANYTAGDIQNDPDFHVQWVSDSVNPSRMLRKLFPRQRFMSKKSEVNLLKSLFVMAPQAPAFEMKADHRTMPTNWYVQGSGSRRIRMTPHTNCADKCPEINVILNAGDILCFCNMYWNVESSPVAENPNITVAFIGSFE